MQGAARVRARAFGGGETQCRGGGGILESLITQKQADIKAYETDIHNREQLLREYEAEIAAQNAEIKELEEISKTLQKQLEEANGKKKTYDGGMFAWPAPSYTRISDDYGERMHPTLNVKKFHNGLDFSSAGRFSDSGGV